MSGTELSPKLAEPEDPIHITSWIYKEPEAVREYLTELFFDWSGHGHNIGRHHDFSPGHKIRWQNEKAVDDGAYGKVTSTHIKVEGKTPTAIAIKRVELDYGDTPKQLSEIKIIKRLRHKHVVKLLGSYSYRGELHLLLHPLASSNLQKVLKCTESLRHYFGNIVQPGTDCLDVLNVSVSKLNSTNNTVWGHTSRLINALCMDDLLESDRILGGVLRECISRLFGMLGCLAESVAYIHSHSVHHKDIKPGNILVCSQDQGGLRLTDFGFSKERKDSHSMVGQVLTGTIDYVPPEQNTPGALYGIEADIFSLGCVFLDLMTALTLEFLFQPEDFQNLKYVTSLTEGSREVFDSTPWLRRKPLSVQISRFYKHESSSVKLELHSLIQQMVEIKSQERPKANQVLIRLGILEQVRKTKDPNSRTSSSLFGSCCGGPVLKTDDYRLLRGIFGTDGDLAVPPVRHLRYSLHRNSLGERIDPPLEASYDKAEFMRVSNMNMCKSYHLLDYCENSGSCRYMHYTNATEGDIRMLRRIVRSRVKCPSELSCLAQTCILGHNCPFSKLEDKWLQSATRTDTCAHGGPRSRGGTCIFPLEMHDLDLTSILPPISGI